jgi:uncharacterized protein YndB with AHSA1/START domain
MWKKILVGLAALLAILVAVIASRPATYHVERSALVAAPPRAVYERVADFRRWSEWSPWAHVDPKMKQSFEGAPSGTGAEYAWSGNSQIGEGRMSILEARPDERVAMRMDLTRPLKSTSTTELRLSPEGGGVRVVWVMDGRRNFAGKAVALLASMDARLGRDFEKGLEDLKRVAEAEAARGAGGR